MRRVDCKACHGEGRVDSYMGDRDLRCETCHGHGFLLQPKCPTCKGTGNDPHAPLVAKP